MKTAVIKTFILLIVLLTGSRTPLQGLCAEESVIIDGCSADIPPELEKSLGRRNNAAKHRQ